MDHLVDTNVVLRWANEKHPDYGLAAGAVGRLRSEGHALFVVAQNLIEFWGVATRPLDRNGMGLTYRETETALDRVEAFFELAEDTPEIYRVWRHLVVEAGVSGVKVHDARLAACMLVHGLPRILTFNTGDFVRYPGIEAVHPRDVVSD